MMNFALETGLNIYSGVAIDIPDFEAFVIYIGERKTLSHVRVDEEGNEYISLNETFFGGRAGRPELRARVIHMDNVTGILKEYYDYCKIFDKHNRALHDKKETKQEALVGIFAECKAAGVLTEYLEKRRVEVERIMSGLLTQEMVDEMTQRSDKIEASIASLRGVNVPESQIRDQLVKQYGISEKYAQNYLDIDPDRDRNFVPLI